MANANPLTLLADALAAVSKTAYHALSEVESQAREEIARALEETREAMSERDKAVNDTHSAQLEVRSCKHELTECKATLGQAELTVRTLPLLVENTYKCFTIIQIVHQTDKISQLQRELSQWKDQSRNWQEHFLRVEQERCALSTRVEELVSERLQWIQMDDSRHAPYTPKLRYTDVVHSAPSSSTTKENSIPSPTNPPPYKSVGQRTESPIQASPVKSSRAKSKTGLPSRAGKSRQAEEPMDSIPETVYAKQKAEKQKSVSAPRQTIIRRVHAVVHLKQESDDEPLEHEEEPESPVQPRRRRRAVEDEDYEENSDVERGLPETEGNDDEEEDDDELMMGAEVCKVYLTKIIYL
ncbi:hypothetical protein BDQ17DRAFT_1231959 [Cyathus striatus]|nr:hypothetical protein BDQ17DRAFT_1231959 [Cyathus striatus]